VSKEVTAINRAKEKSFIQGRVVHDDDKQERHNHPNALMINIKTRIAKPPPMIRVVPPTRTC
jgi:hypothetical protein